MCSNRFPAPWRVSRGARRLAAGVGASVRRLGAFTLRVHRDESGTISILTVVTLLMFTILWGMLINVGQHVDDKVKMQNAADAATYSGSVAIARGMNAIAFTNHLLSEIFAMTAYLREGEARSSEAMVPEVLAAWERIGPIFAASSFPKFAALGPAITQKVPLETEVIAAFSEMTAIKAEIMLPVLEYILGEPEPSGAPESHLIPEFQRAVVRAIPGVAQSAMREIAERHGPASEGTRSRPLTGVLWRTGAMPVGYPNEYDPTTRTLPAVDPSQEGNESWALSQAQIETARRQRESLARHYLESWINADDFDMHPFERNETHEGGKVSAKMSQFINFWRVFTCGQLTHLLDVEFPNSNLPHVLRTTAGNTTQQTLDADYMFVGVVYWPQRPQFFPGFFRSPMQGDAMAFAQASVFLPRPRYRCCPWSRIWYDRYGEPHYIDYYDNWPRHWDLFNQNWTTQLVPAATPNLAEILQSSPGNVANVSLPSLGGVSTQEIQAINFH